MTPRVSLPPACGLFLFLFSACSSWQEGWTPEYQQQFTKACRTGDGRMHTDPPQAYCDCALQKTMHRYPTIAAFMELKDTAAYRQELQSCP